jgi:hypothetical protein
VAKAAANKGARSSAPIARSSVDLAKRHAAASLVNFGLGVTPKAIFGVAKRLRRDRGRFKLRSNDYLNVRNFAPVSTPRHN